jgi:hypothetical protein
MSYYQKKKNGKEHLLNENDINILEDAVEISERLANYNLKFLNDLDSIIKKLSD